MAVAEASHAATIATTLQSTKLAVHFETKSRMKMYITKLQLAASLGRSLAEEVNADAVWLREEREELDQLESWLEEYSACAALVSCQNTLVSSLLRRAVLLRYDVKVRGQTVLSDYSDFLSDEADEEDE